MTVTTRKTESDLTPVARYEQHNEQHRIIHTIKSASGITYKVCIENGKVTGCEDSETGEMCKSFYYRRSCHHATLAMQLEGERLTEAYASRLHNGVTLARYNETVENQNSEASLERRIKERETSQKGALNGSSQGFSLLK